MLNILICLRLPFLLLWEGVQIDTFHEIAFPEDMMCAETYLIAPESLPPRVRYERLFSDLPEIRSVRQPGPGRRPVSRDALLKALVYKSLRRFATLSDLVFDLNCNPAMGAAVGFGPERRIPSVQRFSAFLRDTDHEDLQAVRRELVARLQSREIISGTVLSIDSCPIVSPLKENNLKTSLRCKRFDKINPPKGDPEAGLGIICHFPTPSKKEVSWFWGYRNHVMNDALSELPIWEITHPANVSDLPPCRTALHWAKETFNESVGAFTADAEYDSEDILKFIVEQLKAEPVIPRNPRNQQNTQHTIRGTDVFCAAEMPMAHRGKMTDKKTGITYRIYSCPLYWRKKMQQQHLFCPAQHPKYFSQKGCNVLIRLSPSIRSQIPYGAEQFKKTYNQRSGSERGFSRLLSIASQEPTVRGLNATRNHVTVAHIAVLLVASAAHRDGHTDKMRFVRSYVPNFLT